jgi:N-methylhydantoinase B
LTCTALGGTSAHDGASIIQAMNHITPSAPVEIVESEYPVMVRQYGMWEDSAGPGRLRGGIGYVRDYQVLTDCIMTARTSNHHFSAWGLAGGGAPRTSRTTINPDGADREELGPIVTRSLNAGDVIRLEQSGGGGYGDPFEREPAAVAADVRNGYVSLLAARERYGVVLDAATFALDSNATDQLRAARAATAPA